MADCSLASLIALMFWPSAQQPSTACLSTSKSQRAAAGGDAWAYSAIRREVPIRTFNDWKSPPPGLCEVDKVAHGGTSVAGSFIQNLTMIDIATGWPECLPLLTRDGSLMVEAMKHAQGLFSWLLEDSDVFPANVDVISHRPSPCAPR